jgi:hypothetical protein
LPTEHRKHFSLQFPTLDLDDSRWCSTLKAFPTRYLFTGLEILRDLSCNSVRDGDGWGGRGTAA